MAKAEESVFVAILKKDWVYVENPSKQALSLCYRSLIAEVLPIPMECRGALSV
jgi:hypothetical protein